MADNILIDYAPKLQDSLLKTILDENQKDLPHIQNICNTHTLDAYTTSLSRKTDLIKQAMSEATLKLQLSTIGSNDERANKLGTSIGEFFAAWYLAFAVQQRIGHDLYRYNKKFAKQIKKHYKKGASEANEAIKNIISAYNIQYGGFMTDTNKKILDKILDIYS